MRQFARARSLKGLVQRSACDGFGQFLSPFVPSIPAMVRCWAAGRVCGTQRQLCSSAPSLPFKGNDVLARGMPYPWQPRRVPRTRNFSVELTRAEATPSPATPVTAAEPWTPPQLSPPDLAAPSAAQAVAAVRRPVLPPLAVPPAEPWPELPALGPVTEPPPLQDSARYLAQFLGPWAQQVQEDQTRLQTEWARQGLPVLAYHGLRTSFFFSQYMAQIVVAGVLLAQQAQSRPRAEQKQHRQASTRAQGTTQPAPSPGLSPSGPLPLAQQMAQRVGMAISTLMTRVLPGLLELQRRDAAYVAQGIYRAPYDMSPRHRQWQPQHIWDTVWSSVAFTSDVIQRRQRNGWQETLLFSEEARANRDKYPEYYLQNFHFQDGWLSDLSAQGYEAATETLFLGVQDAMQRAGLVPLHYFMKGRAESETVVLDLACGTGRFLTFLKDNYPQVKTIGVDLSPQFLKKAEENMRSFEEFNTVANPNRQLGPSEFVQGPAEAIPLPSSSIHVVSCVYLFHEIPPDVRKQVASEIFRVLCPGGILILNDSIQTADKPTFDLSLFPVAYHEPYYASYLDTDIPALFCHAGFDLAYESVAHLSKVWCFQKLH